MTALPRLDLFLIKETKLKITIKQMQIRVPQSLLAIFWFSESNMSALLIAGYSFGLLKKIITIVIAVDN